MALSEPSHPKEKAEIVNHERRQLLTTAIRPFHIDFPERDIVDLRHRLAATRWTEKETVADDTQGVPLATMRELVRHWQTDYNWRKIEAQLDALPQFITEIDRLDIHFIHVKADIRGQAGPATPLAFDPTRTLRVARRRTLKCSFAAHTT